MRRSAAALSVMLSFIRGSGIREIAMTPEQALQWLKDGILTIPGALPPTDVDRLKAGINKKYGQFLSGEISNFSLDHESATYMPELWRKLLTPPRPCQTFKRWNIVADDPDFIGLIDRAPVFDLVGSGAKGSPDESQLTFECFRQQLQPMKAFAIFWTQSCCFWVVGQTSLESCLARRQLSFWKPTGWGAEIQVTTAVDARR
jgi:hypothetical protein